PPGNVRLRAGCSVPTIKARTRTVPVRAWLFGALLPPQPATTTTKATANHHPRIGADTNPRPHAHGGEVTRPAELTRCPTWKNPSRRTANTPTVRHSGSSSS